MRAIDLFAGLGGFPEGAGAFVVVRQENGESHIAIDPDEWPALREAITQMICTAQGVEAPTLSGEPT